MKKILMCAILLASMSAFAQETYENANIATENLNGTARYVGMGGAMEALGADISTIGTNPAGIGMFRRQQITLTAGFVSQPNAASSNHVDGTNASFDQVGAVWSTNMGNHRFLNFAINYHKSRNFDNILSATNSLSGPGQNRVTYNKAYDGVFAYDNCYNQVDYLYENAVNYNETEAMWYYYDASGYNFKKATKGYVGDYDFNISGNVSSRVYLGLTFGIKDVHYDGYTEYSENIVDENGAARGSVTMGDERHITGSGFNIKAGAIFFPIEDNAFRIGLSVATPTWYDLKTWNYTTIQNGIDEDYCDYGYNNGNIDEEYDYRINTPWKFGVSLGHTVGKQLALGASYEYAGYNYLSTRVLDGSDGWGGTRSYRDGEMCNHTKKTLQGVHTLKLGAEYKVLPDLAVRVGYNYVTPMYKSEGYRDGAINSPGTYYSSTTDYTNWKATNRITFGLGYQFGQFGVDFAYQYQATKGDFYPFAYKGTTGCTTSATSVKEERHQFLATLSYKF